MSKLIFYSSELAQWQALVSEASLNLSQASLSQELESYLVFLLMRFAARPDVTDTALGMDYLESQDLHPREKQQNLRDVGDKCLLFAGLFPQLAERRRIKLSYYVNLGRVAYANLSSMRTEVLSDLFAKLSHEFVHLVDILHSIRDLNTKTQSLDLLEAQAFFQDTQSQHALSLLKKKIADLSPWNLFQADNSLKH